MLETNKLKAKLNKGLPVLGTWNTLASPLVTEIFAQSGLDFQIIDLEHGPFILDILHLHNIRSREAAEEFDDLENIDEEE